MYHILPHSGITKNRNPSLDCMRGIAIFLTCYAHFCALGRTDFNWHLNVTIYQFHMPLFCFVSGACTNYSSKYLSQRILSLFSEYIAAQTLFFLLFWKYIVPTDLLLYPQGINWYFLSQLFWLILYLLCSHFPFIYVFSFSIAFSLFFGFVNIDQNIFGIGRTFFLFPFFMLGAHTAGDFLPKGKRIVLPLILSYLCLNQFYLAFNLEKINRSWYFGSYTYAQQSYTPFIRILIYCTAFAWIAIISQLTAFPALQKLLCIRSLCKFFSYIGQHSLSIYFLHGLVYMWMIYHSLSFDRIPALPREFVLLIFSLLVTSVCSLPLASKFVHLILHFPYKIASIFFKTATPRHK